MIRKEIEILNKLGLHARAAAKLVTCAGAFASQVRLEWKGRRVNGKSIMDVMMLAAAQGSMVTLLIEGKDEAAACAALERLIADRFGEDE
ncbi:HPr family phosphocarrier protein [Candidatus Thiosymbion oneisti]|uniref:HPr family phosphocarrier protein n=1 Tax=Candidatus Thiosymbion oneisti TaxID=589554 RepID=UPI000AFDF741|nr:HPr family phosphocarrier protein [Candidatus Thiosymbion oneisti]